MALSDYALERIKMLPYTPIIFGLNMVLLIIRSAFETAVLSPEDSIRRATLSYIDNIYIREIAKT